MKNLIQLIQSGRGKTALAITSAVLAVGISTRVEYDPDDDELRITLRKIRPLTQALAAVSVTR